MADRLCSEICCICKMEFSHCSLKMNIRIFFCLIFVLVLTLMSLGGMCMNEEVELNNVFGAPYTIPCLFTFYCDFRFENKLQSPKGTHFIRHNYFYLGDQ
jgi:hypothetical protein